MGAVAGPERRALPQVPFGAVAEGRVEPNGPGAGQGAHHAATAQAELMTDHPSLLAVILKNI